jgi:4-hydroxybenzoate polyprenyltransferase
MNMGTERIYLKTLSVPFLRAYVVTMRPYLMFVSGITGLVGMAFNVHVSMSAFTLRFAASFLSYGFGQALTDCFQIDTDSISSPYRPLTQGMISKIQTFLVSAVGLTFCIAIFAAGNVSNLLLGAAAGVGLATYTLFKRQWWGGPFYNAWIVTDLCSMAFLSGGESFLRLASPSMIRVLVCVLFAYANFVLSGYFKDIEADRATGYNTLPVVFGKKVSAIISDVLAAVAVCFAFLCVSETGLLAGWIVFLPAAGLSLFAQVQLHLVSTDNEAHRAIVPVVHAYILLLSSVVVSQKPEWGGFLCLFYAAFIAVLAARPAANQI